MCALRALRAFSPSRPRGRGEIHLILISGVGISPSEVQVAALGNAGPEMILHFGPELQPQSPTIGPESQTVIPTADGHSVRLCLHLHVQFRRERCLLRLSQLSAPLSATSLDKDCRCCYD